MPIWRAIQHWSKVIILNWELTSYQFTISTPSSHPSIEAQSNHVEHTSISTDTSQNQEATDLPHGLHVFFVFFLVLTYMWTFLCFVNIGLLLTFLAGTEILFYTYKMKTKVWWVVRGTRSVILIGINSMIGWMWFEQNRGILPIRKLNLSSVDSGSIL